MRRLQGHEVRVCIGNRTGYVVAESVSSISPLNSNVHFCIKLLLWSLSMVQQDKDESALASLRHPLSSTIILGSEAPSEPNSSNSVASVLWKEARYSSFDENLTQKRSDYISWDDYFMAVAALSAKRSKDPHHATGACIVDKSNRIIGTGYNGFPSGCSDDVLPWNDSSFSTTSDPMPWLHTKNPFMVHAEVNAILNKCAGDCSGSRLYTPYFPCNECAKVIVQSRISEVVYIRERYCGSGTSKSLRDDSLRASRILLTMGNVRIRQYMPVCDQLHIAFSNALESEECTLHEAAISLTTTHDRERTECVRFRDLMWNEAKYDVFSATTRKKPDYLSWDDYFMSMAFLTAQRSKDPNTQVGACIVDGNKRIVGLGYNGFPSGCSDDFLPWAREAESELHTKYMYVCHAEVNAILNKGSADVRGATLYVALFPCNECSKVIIQAGIREVVFMSERYRDTDCCRASRILLQLAGVRLRKYVPSIPSICIRMDGEV
jgi:dCMP deaminase